MPAPNTHTLHHKPQKASKNTTDIFARTPPNCEPKLLQKRCFSGVAYRTLGTPKKYKQNLRHQPTIAEYI